MVSNNLITMRYHITHQESYSRGELLLRTFFGWLYILIPHIFLLYIFGIAMAILAFLAFWVILFTGETPEWYYSFYLRMQRWGLRVSSRVLNLADGYPAFGLNGTDDKTEIDLPLIHIGRGQLLLRFLFGWLMLIPHIIVIYFRLIGMYILIFLAWWAVLFTGRYPMGWHNFNVGTMRWLARISFWSSWLYPEYPPFSGRPDEEEADRPIDQMA